MAEGSDRSGSELGEMEEGGRSYEEWNTVSTHKRKKSKNNKSDDSDCDRRAAVVERRREDYKVIVKPAQEGASFGNWNPIQLTQSINNEIGEVRCTKILRNGSLLIICRDGGQQGRAIRMKQINGRKVQCTLTRDRNLVRGVVTGIPVNVSADVVKGNVKNAKVSEVKHLKANRNGIKCDSLSIMITFDEEKLPEKIFIGYMCYDVRLYVPPPLRCFTCQSFGHVAAVCRESKDVVDVVETMSMANVQRGQS